ncbi:MAG: hypothetical protein ABI120_14800 [Gemmatimonadaceae bacterium]
MPHFFPRDVIQWRDQALHPLRAFSLSTLELAGITGVLLRLLRVAAMSASTPMFVLGVVFAVLFLCGMLTWHLGNFPLRRWPLRAAWFTLIEVTAELGTSSVLIVLHREPLGTRLAGWRDWWSLAGQTVVERVLIVLVYSIILAASVQLVRKLLDRKRVTPVTGVAG